MKIDVLGTKYNLRRVNFDQDEFMRKMNYGGLNFLSNTAMMRQSC